MKSPDIDRGRGIGAINLSYKLEVCISKNCMHTADIGRRRYPAKCYTRWKATACTFSLSLICWKWGNHVEKNSGSFLIFEKGKGQNVVLDHCNPSKQTLKLSFFFLDIKDWAWIFSRHLENNELETTFNFQCTCNNKNQCNFTFFLFSHCIAGRVWFALSARKYNRPG